MSIHRNLCTNSTLQILKIRLSIPSHIPQNGNENKKKTPGIITQPCKIRTEQGNDPSKQISEYLLYTIENPLENDR